MQTYQTSCLCCLRSISVLSHRPIGLFILTADSQYNVFSEIITAWDLSNDMPGTICMRFVLKFQQTESFGLCLFFLGSPKPMRMHYTLPRYRFCVVLLCRLDEAKTSLVHFPQYAEKEGNNFNLDLQKFVKSHYLFQKNRSLSRKKYTALQMVLNNVYGCIYSWSTF